MAPVQPGSLAPGATLEDLSASDGAYGYGMAGLRLGAAGRMSVGRLEVEDY